MVLNNSFNYIFTVKPLLNHTSLEHKDQNGAFYPTKMVHFTLPKWFIMVYQNGALWSPPNCDFNHIQ